MFYICISLKLHIQQLFSGFFLFASDLFHNMVFIGILMNLIDLKKMIFSRKKQQLTIRLFKLTRLCNACVCKYLLYSFNIESEVNHLPGVVESKSIAVGHMCDSWSSWVSNTYRSEKFANCIIFILRQFEFKIYYPKDRLVRRQRRLDVGEELVAKQHEHKLGLRHVHKQGLRHVHKQELQRGRMVKPNRKVKPSRMMHILNGMEMETKIKHQFWARINRATDWSSSLVERKYLSPTK